MKTELKDSADAWCYCRADRTQILREAEHREAVVDSSVVGVFRIGERAGVDELTSDIDICTRLMR